MTANLVYPDTMNDVRYWLRNHPNLVDLCPGKVFFRLPDKPIAPFIRISQNGGGPELDSEVPMDLPRNSWQIWGMLPSVNYDVLRKIKLALQDACWRIGGDTLINPTGNTILCAARFNTASDIPDPDTGWPRIICDVELVAKAALPTVV